MAKNTAPKRDDDAAQGSTHIDGDVQGDVDGQYHLRHPPT
jgi:hypothetical protein